MVGTAGLGRLAGTTLMVAWTWGKLTFLLAHLLGLSPVLPLALMGAGTGAVLGGIVALCFPEKAAITAIVGLPLPEPLDRFLRRQALLLGALVMLASAVCLARLPQVRPVLS